MAWPLTPFRSMNDGTTFWDAALGNALQTGVNGIIAGTYSLAAVVVDGTGGATVAPTAGTMKLSAAASGTSAPTASFTTGLYYADACPSAMIRWNTAGSTFNFVRGFNVSSGTRSSAGTCDITLLSAITSWSTAFMGAAVLTGGTTVSAGAAMTSSTNLRVYTYTASSGAAADSTFDACVVVFGK